MFEDVLPAPLMPYGADLQVRFQIYNYFCIRRVTPMEELEHGQCRLWCHDEPAADCDVYWGSHGCGRQRGHDGDCACDCGSRPGPDTRCSGDDVPRRAEAAV